MPKATIYVGGSVFDGKELRQAQASRWVDDVFSGFLPNGAVGAEDRVIDLEGGILTHGYVDLQVNGGDGVMLNDTPSLPTLQRMTRAHRRLGSICILPTLITDTPDVTAATIHAAIEAISFGLTGLVGLHLEGPHLSVARKGAHDPALIRRMEADDLSALIDAKRSLPVLKVTLAPENATLAQVKTLADAGVLVSIGHTDADFDTCMAYVEAGARCATHLFNAMSQLGSRQPGLVGAVLTNGDLSAGLIADGIHVHPATIQSAWRAKTGPGQIFLVSDAMAVAGTDRRNFHLGGRKIIRQGGRLTLEDGTLAGADLDLTRAIRVLVAEVGLPVEDALRAATTTPADLIGLKAGLVPGETSLTQMIRIAPDFGSATPLVELGELGSRADPFR